MYSMKLKNRIQLLGLSTILVGGFVYAQIYIHNKNSKEIKEIAAEIAAEWKEKLGLTPEQTKKLEDNIIEFTIRKNDIINSNRSQKFIIRDLKQTQQKEHKKLKRFLTSTQFTAYVGINKKIPNELMDA
jgi:ribosomal protein RSM22 (predicted rRNA methylase)